MTIHPNLATFAHEDIFVMRSRFFIRVWQLLVAICFFLSSSFIASADAGVVASNDNIDTLYHKAHQSGMPEDWKIVLVKAKENNDTAYIGKAYVFYIQALNNMHFNSDTDNADEVISKEIKEALDFLHKSKQNSYYFIIYNIYIDWLFAKKSYKEAQDEAAKMYLLAMEMEHPLGGAVALRVQGQIFYKLNLYEKAVSTLKEGLKMCPSYKTDMKTYSTAQSICEWLIMSYLKLNDCKNADFYTDFYGVMLEYWKGKGWQEPTGHYDVTHLSLKAKVEVMSGNHDDAKRLLDEAKEYIRPEYPANAYEHYYEANTLLLKAERKYDEAIANVDTLLEAHSCYYPFYLRDLLVKAELLTLSGRSIEGIDCFKKYLKANDSLMRAENLRQLDKLRVQYQIEKAEDEVHDKTMYLRFASVIIILISLLLTLSVVNSRKLKAYNKIMVSRLEEYDKRASSFMPHEHDDAEPQDNTDNNGNNHISIHELMERVELYMRENHPFKNPAFNRERLAKAVKVNEKLLGDAIKETNNITVTEYINMCRLDYSRQLLSSDSIMPLKEIAEVCGFGTQRTFQRLFRDKYGMPPSQYRKIIVDANTDSPTSGDNVNNSL